MTVLYSTTFAYSAAFTGETFHYPLRSLAKIFDGHDQGPPRYYFPEGLAFALLLLQNVSQISAIAVSRY